MRFNNFAIAVKKGKKQERKSFVKYTITCYSPAPLIFKAMQKITNLYSKQDISRNIGSQEDKAPQDHN